MARKKSNDYKITKGYSTLVGKISGLDELKKELMNEKGEVTTSISKNGFESKRLNFGIQTSENNTVRVGIFGGKNEDVYFMPIDSKSDLTYKKVPFNNRHTVPKDYHCIDTALRSKGDKNDVKKFKWDAVDYILENFKDGETVTFNSTIKWKEYNGSIQSSDELSKMRVRKSELDFDSEDFKEVNKFQQTIIVKGFHYKKGDEEGTLECYIITRKDGSFVSAELPVEVTKDNSKFIRKLGKIPEGSYLTVHGRVLNTVEEVEVELEKDEEWGVTEDISKEESRVITNYTSKKLVIYADAKSYEESAVDIDELEASADKDDFDDNYSDSKKTTSSSNKKSVAKKEQAKVKDTDISELETEDWDFSEV